MASPLSGAPAWSGRCAPVGAPTRRRDHGAPMLADLPGRFWFAFDDGRGDVSALRADAGVQDAGPRFGRAAAVRRRHRGPAAGRRVGARPGDHRGAVPGDPRKRWRMTELSDGSHLVTGGLPAGPRRPCRTLDDPTPVGWIEQHDGLIALGAVVPAWVCCRRVPRSSWSPWKGTDDRHPVALGAGVRSDRGRWPTPHCRCCRRRAWCSTRTRPGCGSAPAWAVRGERAGADVRAEAVRAVAAGPRAACTMWVASGPAAARPTVRVMVATPDGYLPRIPS